MAARAERLTLEAAFPGHVETGGFLPGVPCADVAGKERNLPSQ